MLWFNWKKVPYLYPTKPTWHQVQKIAKLIPFLFLFRLQISGQPVESEIGFISIKKSLYWSQNIQVKLHTFPATDFLAGGVIHL